jgi:hypothetical protein
MLEAHCPCRQSSKRVTNINTAQFYRVRVRIFVPDDILELSATVPRCSEAMMLRLLGLQAN